MNLNVDGLFVMLPDCPGISELVLHCPVCKHDTTHVQRAWSEEGSDPGEPEGRSEHGELYGVPVGGISGGRRGSLVIEVWCEQNHQFVIRFQQHKGATFITADRVSRL